MGRRLVQVKQCRSNPVIGDYIVRCLAKSTARSVTCLDTSRRSSGYVRAMARGDRKPPRRIRRMHVARPEEVPSRRAEAAPIRSPAR